MNLMSNPKLKMRAPSRREKFLAALLALFLLLMLYQRYIFEPQLNNINKLKSDITNQQNVLTTRLDQGWSDIPLLKARSEEIEKQIDLLYIKVPNIVDEPNLLVDFYTLAKLNGLQADKIKFDQLQQVEGYNYSTISLHLDITGLNSDIYNFIADLERYPRLNKVYEVTFEPQDATTSICSLSVEFYVLGEIKSDPMDYPFMEGQYGKEEPYQIFDAYIKETETEQSESVANNIEETGHIQSQPVENTAEETHTPGEITPDSWVPENDQTEWRWIPTFPGWIPAPGSD